MSKPALDLILAGETKVDVSEMTVPHLRKALRERFGYTAADYKGLDKEELVDYLEAELENADSDSDDDDEVQGADNEYGDMAALRAAIFASQARRRARAEAQYAEYDEDE